MSNIKIRDPIIHIPSFNEYVVSGQGLALEYSKLGIKMPFPRSDGWYYYTDAEGWVKLLADLAFKSNLYKRDRFDCEDYAMKAQVTCAERYGLNTLRYTYGTVPEGAHGFCSCWTGDRFLLFEPNEGWWGYLDGHLYFELGENKYQPKAVLI